MGKRENKENENNMNKKGTKRQRAKNVFNCPLTWLWGNK